MSICSQPMNENLECRRPRRQCRQDDGAPIFGVERIPMKKTVRIISLGLLAILLAVGIWGVASGALSHQRDRENDS